MHKNLSKDKLDRENLLNNLQNQWAYVSQINSINISKIIWVKSK